VFGILNMCTNAMSFFLFFFKPTDTLYSLMNVAVTLIRLKRLHSGRSTKDKLRGA
jgi:hypothetical protein